MANKILFVDTHRELVQDLETNYLLYTMGGGELYCCTSADQIDSMVKRHDPDLIVLGTSVLRERESWYFDGRTTVYYARSRSDLTQYADCGLPTIGIASKAGDIIKLFDVKPYMPAPRGGKKTAAEETPAAEGEKKNTKEKAQPERVQEKDEKKTEKPAHRTKEEPLSLDDFFKQEFGLAKPNKDPDKEKREETPDPPRKMETLQSQTSSLYAELFADEEEEEPLQKKTKKSEKRNEKSDEKKGEDLVESGFQKDLRGNKGKTKVVTVYSAKGGVGKTTISAELAEYLALVQTGPGRLKVALVDYNIDFGDIMATLAKNPKAPNPMGTDPEGPVLTYWAKEIEERMEEGENPEEIKYTMEEIEKRMQVDGRSGLFILPAPLTNTDSTDLKTEALDAILRNIVENGGFDIVVCDTGNNTRDSTVIALVRATIILLVMTQSVNAAQDYDSFKGSMEYNNFDLSKARLVINCIMPRKETGVSVQDILENFKGMECVGKIRFNPSVIKAGNLARPLAFQPDNEFTRQLRSVVAYVLDDANFEKEEPKKNGIFRFLPFGKKKKKEKGEGD